MGSLVLFVLGSFHDPAETTLSVQKDFVMAKTYGVLVPKGSGGGQRRTESEDAGQAEVHLDRELKNLKGEKRSVLGARGGREAERWMNSGHSDGGRAPRTYIHCYMGITQRTNRSQPNPASNPNPGVVTTPIASSTKGPPKVVSGGGRRSEVFFQTDGDCTRFMHVSTPHVFAPYPIPRCAEYRNG